jgi:hypothetical protein
VSDRDEILAVHKEWFNSAIGLDTERAKKCCAKGSSFRMYNTNGHVYKSWEDFETLWKHYGETIDVSECRDDDDVVIHVEGDLAYLYCDREVMDITPLKPEGLGSSVMEPLAEDEATRYPFLGTEVYRRDDGEGNKQWRIWHQHFSVAAPQDETRPGF